LGDADHDQGDAEPGPVASSTSDAAGPHLDQPFRHQVGSEGDVLVFVEGGDVFTMREWATWRWRPREDGSFEVAAWRDGTSLGVAIVPASVGPGGNVNLN
jgi:hypothetical protein